MLAAESVCAVITAQQRDVKCRLRTVCDVLRCDRQALTPVTLAVLGDHLQALHEAGACGSGPPVQRFLYSAIASASASAAGAVDRVVQAQASEAASLHAAQRALRAVANGESTETDTLVRVFRVHCNQTLDRLEDEELLLLPLARRSLSAQQWGSIASAASKTMVAEAKTPAPTVPAFADVPSPRLCPLWQCPPDEASDLFRCRAACPHHAQLSTAAPETRPARRSSSAALAATSG